MSTFQRTLFMTVFATAATLILPKTAHAKSVMCVAGYGCIHSERSCEDRFGANYKTELANSFGACVNYAIAQKPAGSVVLHRGGGRPASITIDGKESRIASAGLESFLDRSLKDERVWKQSRTPDSKFAKQFMTDLRAFLAKDPGISEDGLRALSRDLKIPIR